MVRRDEATLWPTDSKASTYILFSRNNGAIFITPSLTAHKCACFFRLFYFIMLHFKKKTSFKIHVRSFMDFWNYFKMSNYCNFCAGIFLSYSYDVINIINNFCENFFVGDFASLMILHKLLKSSRTNCAWSSKIRPRIMAGFVNKH